MTHRSRVIPLLLALAAPGLAHETGFKPDVGDPAPVNLPLEGFTAAGATHFEEYTGRAVLFEFFAYW